MLKEISAQLIRDLCTCLECRDPKSGQRLRSVTAIDPQIEINLVEELEFAYRFTLSDEHVVVLLHEIIEDINGLKIPMNWRSEGSKLLWDGQSAPSADFEWELMQNSSLELLEMLDQLIVFGYAKVSGLPQVDRTVIDLIHTFGFERITNYGDIFDVRVENNPNNLAFTSMAIAPHTDNPYRDPVPTIQLLHCLNSTVSGGELGLVDGFRAAVILRKNYPEYFDILSRNLFYFQYSNGENHFSALSPIIRINAMDEIVEVRWNDRSMQPPINVEGVNQIYDALRTFALILNDPENSFSFKLSPGDCIIFDNTRTLHSRTAFDSSGARHLQGAYSDLDGAISKRYVLENKLNK